MPRTTGAKNKPKPDEKLIAELEQRGYKITKNGEQKEVKEVKPKKEKVVKLNNESDSGDKGVKNRLEIEKPAEKVNTPEPTIVNPVLRCGNPDCGKILEHEFKTCPFCRVNLTWE